MNPIGVYLVIYNKMLYCIIKDKKHLKKFMKTKSKRYTAIELTEGPVMEIGRMNSLW